MAKAAHVLLGLMLAAVPGTAQTDAQRSELAQLETAIRSVEVAMYSITDRELQRSWPHSPVRVSGSVCTGTVNSSSRRRNGGA